MITDNRSPINTVCVCVCQSVKATWWVMQEMCSNIKTLVYFCCLLPSSLPPFLHPFICYAEGVCVCVRLTAADMLLVPSMMVLGYMLEGIAVAVGCSSVSPDCFSNLQTKCRTQSDTHKSSLVQHLLACN